MNTKSCFLTLVQRCAPDTNSAAVFGTAPPLVQRGYCVNDAFHSFAHAAPGDSGSGVLCASKSAAYESPSMLSTALSTGGRPASSTRLGARRAGV